MTIYAFPRHSRFTSDVRWDELFGTIQDIMNESMKENERKNERKNERENERKNERENERENAPKSEPTVSAKTSGIQNPKSMVCAARVYLDYEGSIEIVQHEFTIFGNTVEEQRRALDQYLTAFFAGINLESSVQNEDLIFPVIQDCLVRRAGTGSVLAILDPETNTILMPRWV